MNTRNVVITIFGVWFVGRRSSGVQIATRAKEDGGWGPTILLSVLVSVVALLGLNALSVSVIPYGRNDQPVPVPADIRCIRSHGRWSSGIVNGHYAGWCTWER